MGFLPNLFSKRPAKKKPRPLSKSLPLRPFPPELPSPKPSYNGPRPLQKSDIMLFIDISPENARKLAADPTYHPQEENRLFVDEGYVARPRTPPNWSYSDLLGQFPDPPVSKLPPSSRYHRDILPPSPNLYNPRYAAYFEDIGAFPWATLNRAANTSSVSINRKGLHRHRSQTIVRPGPVLHSVQVCNMSSPRRSEHGICGDQRSPTRQRLKSSPTSSDRPPLVPPVHGGFPDLSNLPPTKPLSVKKRNATKLD